MRLRWRKRKPELPFGSTRDFEFMADSLNHNSPATFPTDEWMDHAPSDIVRHIYVHIPFCARICPYCAFYKELLDRSQTERFCQAILCEVSRTRKERQLCPSTIYFGGGTPTALTTTQLEFLLSGLRDQLDLSQLLEWTMEANPGSISARKAALLRKLGVNRISLGIQSWDDNLLKLLGRDHRASHLEESFRILRDAEFSNINLDLMFGLPGQTLDQWRTTLEKTVSLGPDHISTYCLTFEEDTEFFRRHTRGEFRQDSDADAKFFELTMTILEAARYDHYEISNYARPGFRSAHNRAYWSGSDYLGIGPSAFSTIGSNRWQNIPDYRRYADALLSGQCVINSVEHLTPEMKQAEKIALSLRTDHGAPAQLLQSFPNETREFMRLGLLQRTNDHFVLTRAGKALADSVAEAFV